MIRTSTILSSLLTVALGAALAGTASAETTHGQWQTLTTGNKNTTQVYRKGAEAPYALTGDLERNEPAPARQCRREFRLGANKMPTTPVICSAR